jgi:hypothetical protein
MLGMFLLACTMLMLWISMSGHESSNSNPSFLRDGRQSERGLVHRHRGLQDAAAVDVGLYLALRYVDESVASQLETKDPSNKLVSHFCKSINYQVCKEGEILEPPLVAVITNVPNVLHIVECIACSLCLAVFLFVCRQVEAKSLLPRFLQG